MFLKFQLGFGLFGPVRIGIVLVAGLGNASDETGMPAAGALSCPSGVTGWEGTTSITPSVLFSCASTDLRESRILRSRAARSALSCFSSSSFFQTSPTTCSRTGSSFSMASLSLVYFSIRRGMLSKALMKFWQAVFGSTAKRPLLYFSSAKEWVNKDSF